MTDASPSHVRALPSGPVIFDCDGTLVDTEHTWDAAYATLFARYHAPLNHTHRHRLVGRLT